MTSAIIVPGDKSITHRALMAAALARGRSQIHRALTSLDARSTARVLRTLGARISSLRPGSPVEVVGLGRFLQPSATLDCGNSGTTSRLVTGLIAGHRITARLTGDPSLRSRPMRRVTEPLSKMGARFEPELPDRLPFVIHGGKLQAIRWELPVSSAQLKSALLLAGVVAKVPVEVREPKGLSRDHTERLLTAFGFDIKTGGDGWIRLSGTATIKPFEATIPGDPSSAAFLVGEALLGNKPLTIEHVGLNPTRIGFLNVLRRMGARIEIEAEAEQLGEPVGSIHVQPGSLRGTRVESHEIPGLIDEIPMLAVIAARAEGQTIFEDVGELRVKESDRLALIAANLAALGHRASGEGNTLVVHGSEQPPRGRVKTESDHRIAMAFSVLGAVPGARIAVDDRDCADVSFPGFFRLLASVRKRK